MTGHDIRLAYEKYGLNALADHLRLSEKHFKHVSQNDPISSYDIDFVGIKFDVKYANPTLISKDKTKAIWDFDLRNKGKKEEYCDFYILIGIRNGIPNKVYIVPFRDAPKRHIRVSIGGYSKYHGYEV